MLISVHFLPLRHLDFCQPNSPSPSCALRWTLSATYLWSFAVRAGPDVLGQHKNQQKKVIWCRGLRSVTPLTHAKVALQKDVRSGPSRKPCMLQSRDEGHCYYSVFPLWTGWIISAHCYVLFSLQKNTVAGWWDGKGIPKMLIELFVPLVTSHVFA